MTTSTITALVSCQVQACAEECSFTLNMVRRLNNEPICEACHEKIDPPFGCERRDWSSLPPVTLDQLRE